MNRLANVRKGTKIKIPCPVCKTEALWISGGKSSANILEVTLDGSCPRMNAMIEHDRDFSYEKFECETLLNQVDKSLRRLKKR